MPHNKSGTRINLKHTHTHTETHAHTQYTDLCSKWETEFLRSLN